MMYGMMMIVELIFQIYFERTFIVIFKSQDFIDFILEKKIILFLSFRIKIIIFFCFLCKITFICSFFCNSFRVTINNNNNIIITLYATILLSSRFY
jgi:hypothetical protein